MSDNSIYEQYESLLGLENNSTDIGDPNQNDDDLETFFTSKEIVKQKKHLEKITEQGSRSDNDGIIEESIHFKRYGSRHIHKYTESEMLAIRESCKNTIVHDYGEHDIYHISDEERAKNDALAEISLKLATLKRSYRRIDQYIEAMRIVVEAWTMLEKNNFLHSKKDFFEMVADGRIVSNRIIMPKMARLKDYNIDMVIAYISNPNLDPSNLLPKKDDEMDSFYDVYETTEDQLNRLFSADELEKLTKMSEDENVIPKMVIEPIKPKYIKGYDKKSFMRRHKKRGNKKDQHITESVHTILNKIQDSNYYKERGYSYTITNSLFEPADKTEDIWDSLFFDGSWSNDDQVKLLDLAIQQEMAKEHPGNDKYKTYGDIAIKKFWDMLEDQGVSTIELRRKFDAMGLGSNSADKAKQELSKKENKKTESAVLQRIIKLNGDEKFKKIIKKAEKDLNEYTDGEDVD